MGLLLELPEPPNFAILVIVGDLAASVQLSDRIALMHLGLLVELKPATVSLAGGRHPALGTLR